MIASANFCRNRFVALRKESVDRNSIVSASFRACTTSLSARRAWIEMYYGDDLTFSGGVSLSARRAWIEISIAPGTSVFRGVALRKESVDRNMREDVSYNIKRDVALRKESVDRNGDGLLWPWPLHWSLSARRAWIEISISRTEYTAPRSRSPQGERG